MTTFVNPLFQKIMILLSLLMIILSIAVPHCESYLTEQRETAFGEKEKKDYHQLVGLAMDPSGPIPVCPWTGKPYVLEKQNGQTVIPWPDPERRYLTAPRFLILGQNAYFRQNLPRVRLTSGHTAPLNQNLTLTNESGRVLARDQKDRKVFEFPKNGGRVIVFGAAGSPPEEINGIMAALPVKHPDVADTALFTLVYVLNGRIETRVLFELPSRTLNPLVLINQAIFPATRPLPQVSLSPL